MGLRQLATCIVAGIEYLVHPQILGDIQETIKPDQIIPVLVLSEAEISRPDRLQEILQYYVDNDDVCSEDFTSILVVKPSTAYTPYDLNALELFSAIYRLDDQKDLPSGPYFLSGPNLHQAWRLYSDELDAFTYGMVPKDVFNPKKFQAIQSGIPVPSRFYAPKPTPGNPLAGVRVAVDDSYDVEGIKTILSSRAWAELYPEPANASANYIAKLIELGATPIGKTKTTQFSTAVEWVDFHPPINPRGDRYQDPSGSSSGAAASLAGYEWLDYSIGVDSGESVRESATDQGLFSLRPSFGSAALDGIKTNAPSYDTIGLLGLSLDDLYMLAKATLDETVSVKGPFLKPTKLLYPVDFFPLPDPVHQGLIEEFVSVLERFLDIERTEVDLEKLWGANPPSEAGNESLEEYMAKAPYWSLSYEYYHAYNHYFLQPYTDWFDKFPFVEASPKYRWDIGARVSPEEYQSYKTRIEIFRSWFNSNIMTSTDTIMVLPYGVAEPKYRDEASKPPTAFEGISPKLLSPLLETPHMVVPFAQIPYMSRISGQKEYRPICGSIMGAKGTDVELISLAKRALGAMRWPTHVEKGRYTFHPRNNSRHVGDSISPNKPPVLRIQ